VLDVFVTGTMQAISADSTDVGTGAAHDFFEAKSFSPEVIQKKKIGSLHLAIKLEIKEEIGGQRTIHPGCASRLIHQVFVEIVCQAQTCKLFSYNRLQSPYGSPQRTTSMTAVRSQPTLKEQLSKVSGRRQS
jgi:hypothetical protein